MSSPERSTSIRRLVVRLVILSIVVYLGLIGFIASQETRLVFAAGRPLGELRPAPPFEQVELPGNDSRQFAWAMPHPVEPDAPWVLYLHGNAANVSSRMNILRYESLRELGLSVLAPEYRGYGGLEGTPSEASLTRDALTGYTYLRETLDVPAERIVIFGWSLGSGVAVNVASRVPASAVILEGAHSSLVDVGRGQYPWVPVRLLMRNPFDSVLKVPSITSPMLFLHSPEDTVIPIELGRRLFDAVRAPREFVEVRGGHIRAAAEDGATFFNAIERFLASHGVLTREPCVSGC
jgi:pimeloyl-ACP methyl ester carboxylesterase